MCFINLHNSNIFCIFVLKYKGYGIRRIRHRYRGTNCLDQIQQESRTSADYDPSQGMTGEELHNFCKFLYSQIQSKDAEISRLTANIKELTDEVRLSRLQQQTYKD